MADVKNLIEQPLHSTVVLLKANIFIICSYTISTLHSTVVLLKDKALKIEGED